jgi:hypothetical protein
MRPQQQTKSLVFLAATTIHNNKQNPHSPQPAPINPTYFTHAKGTMADPSLKVDVVRIVENTSQEALQIPPEELETRKCARDRNKEPVAF